MDSNKSEHSFESIASTSKNISEDTNARCFSKKRKATDTAEQEDQCAKKVASGEQNLDQDKTQKKKSNRFWCYHCGIFISHKCYWEEHIERHHLDENATLCYTCGELFRFGISLHSHRKKIHNDSSLMCVICGSLSKDLKCYLIHMKNNHKLLKADRRIICPICCKEMVRTNIEQHMRKHAGERPFTCSICNETFCQKNNMQQHFLFHIFDSTGQKHYKCNVCGLSFVQSVGLNRHIKKEEHTSLAPSQPDNIPVIIETFLKERKNRKETDSFWECHYCGKKFTSRRYLKTHIKLHHVERNILCKICKEMFTFETNLYNHMKESHNDPTIMCKICGRFSENMESHRRHMKDIHNLQLDYSICPFCNEAIARDNFYTHTREHMRRKDCTYTCPVCKTTSTNKYNWKQHILTHTGKKFFKCTNCDLSYSQRSNLNCHWRKKHTDLVPPQDDIVIDSIIENFLIERNESTIG